MPPNNIGGFFPHFDPITGFPLAARFNIPEVFGQAISYNDQIMILGRWIAAFKKEMETFLCYADGQLKEIDVLRNDFNELREYVNEKFMEIDVHLTTIDGAIIAINNSIGDIQTHLTTIDNSIASINNSLTSIANQISVINDTLTTHGNRLTALEQNVTNLQTDMSNVQSDVDNLQAMIPGLEGDIASLTISVNGVRNDLTTAQNDIIVLQNCCTAVQTTIQSLDDRMTILEGKIPTPIDYEMFTIASIDSSGNPVVGGGNGASFSLIQQNNYKYGKLATVSALLQGEQPNTIPNPSNIKVGSIPNGFRPKYTTDWVHVINSTYGLNDTSGTNALVIIKGTINTSGDIYIQSMTGMDGVTPAIVYLGHFRPRIYFMYMTA